MLLALSLLGASFVSVQVGSFSEETRAVHVVEDLRRRDFDAYFLRVPAVDGGESTYKVRVGKFADTGVARATAERIRQLGYDGAFPATTDLVETQGLSADLTALIGELGSVNPGKVPPKGIGRRLRTYALDYLTLFLLAAGDKPGKAITDLAVWDANPDNQPEIVAVLDGTRAYALFWVRTQSRYNLAELHEGPKTSIGELFDLQPGPEKFIAVRYEKGGDLYLEKGYEIFRWDSSRGTFGAVGTLPLEIVDKGLEPGAGVSRKRRVEVGKVDLDADREILVWDSVDGGASKEHLDVWDWDGRRLDRVRKPSWFEKILEADPNSQLAASGLFGVGVEFGLEDDLEEAQKVFQTLVTRFPAFDESKRAQAAIQQIGERRDRATVYNETGFDEVRAGATRLATQDLREAVRLDPGSAAAHYNLAVARLADGDRLGSLRALKRAVELDPDDLLKMRDKAKGDADLAPLRELPEFKEILQ